MGRKIAGREPARGWVGSGAAGQKVITLERVTAHVSRDPSRPTAPLPRGPAAPPLSGDLGMLLVCLIWGLNFSITKLALQSIPPLPFTAIRFTAASGLLWLVLRGIEGPAPLPPGSLKRLILLGLVGNTAYQLVLPAGRRCSRPGRAK